MVLLNYRAIGLSAAAAGFATAHAGVQISVISLNIARVLTHLDISDDDVVQAADIICQVAIVKQRQ